MNKQIEKLLAQAHIEFAPDSKAVTNRLAELIIRECASLRLTPMQIDDAQYYHGWLDYRDEILKHFGLWNA